MAENAEFKLVRESKASVFNEAVTEAIRLGFKLAGGVVVDTEGRFCIATIKEPTSAAPAKEPENAIDEFLDPEPEKQPARKSRKAKR